MSTPRSQLAKKAKEAALVFSTKMRVRGDTDAEIRLMIKTLQEVLLKRQQERASRKYLKQARHGT